MNEMPMGRGVEQKLKSYLRLWNHCCSICGEPILSKRCASIEHLIPASKGGSRKNDGSPAHYRCNMYRGNNSLIVTAMKLQQFKKIIGVEAFSLWANWDHPARIDRRHMPTGARKLIDRVKTVDVVLARHAESAMMC